MKLLLECGMTSSKNFKFVVQMSVGIQKSTTTTLIVNLLILERMFLSMCSKVSTFTINFYSWSHEQYIS